ncbi:dihydroorotate dehydrogenase electron transfer subunit [bacterium]|nr:dihydroorotate dehydrogenase electron transfer subunit [bacterium]
MERETIVVLENIALNDEHRMLVVKAPGLAAGSSPGQFAELETKGATLLRKPISLAFCDPMKGEATFVFKIVGKGTKALSELAPGQTLDVIGPLGGGFQIKDKPALLIGGGVGTPPMWFLASRIRDKASVKIVLGARDQKDLILAEEFEKLGIEPIFATDNGSRGVRGTVIDAILKAGLPLEEMEMYACGPFPMLRALASLSEERSLSLQVSLEAYMGCGMGVCVGCTVPTKEGMQRVCKEGPVFDSKEIVWSKIR